MEKQPRKCVRRQDKADKTKYGKYLLKHPAGEEWFGKYVTFEGGKDFKSGVSVLYLYVRDTRANGDTMHSHDFDEYLSFIGLDRNHAEDLGAEIEICLGEEQEKHTFNKTTTIYIPKGLPHLPLTFKRVDKPFLLVHIFLTPQYTRSE